MSFFDDDDEPTQVSSAQQRRGGAGARRPARGGGGGGGNYGPSDQQQLLVRRAIAAGVGLLVVILLVLGVKACLDSGNEQAMKDYNTRITEIAKSSDTEVTDQLFEDLRAGNDANALQVAINQLRLVADENVKRAKALDVPGDMSKAQQYVILALNLRAAALQQIAAQIPAATSGKGDPTAAVNKIAGQMQQFLASDVIWSQRVIPDITQAFDGAGIGGQVIPKSTSLNNLGWLAPATVADAVGAQLTASDDGSTGKTIAPGTHGHALDSVAVGSTTLQPEPATNRIPGTAPVTFDVKFTNGGTNDETRVGVTVTITGTGVKTITAKATVAQTQAGQPAEVSIPLATPPPTAKPVQIVVEVEPVPGEKDASNNKQTYLGVFE